MQSVLRAIYPAQCVNCSTLTETDFGLCGPCWRDTGFIGGLVCDTCGTPLPGDEAAGIVQCDDCMTIARPWSRGRAAFLYKDQGRKLVLQLKHGDRTDLARSAGKWMAAVAPTLLQKDTVLVPVPLHWSRLLSRRYNQAALLAHWIGHHLGGLPVAPDGLVRTRPTRKLDNHSRDDRFAALQGVISPHPRRKKIRGRHVLLIDDVMTSGATLSAATEAAFDAGATGVCVLTLARAAKDA